MFVPAASLAAMKGCLSRRKTQQQMRIRLQRATPPCCARLERGLLLLLACLLAKSCAFSTCKSTTKFGYLTSCPTLDFRHQKRLRVFANKPAFDDHRHFSSTTLLGKLEEEEEEEENVSKAQQSPSQDWNEEALQIQVEQQQKQIDELISILRDQQQQQNNGALATPTTFKSDSSTSTKFQDHLPTRGSVNPLKVMLFIDGTWLYYSIHERREVGCPIIRKFGRGWQRKYYFDWAALPRVICRELQKQDPGWSLQPRPVEIFRVNVYTSYKADTSKDSYRFQMYQEMQNANYDLKRKETVGKSEKCIDIQIAVDMLHYATVADTYDVALLLTGDKDFMPAMIRTRQKGRKVGLVSMRAGCNRVLYETSDDESDDNANIRDYDVIWIEDYLDELIKPKQGGITMNSDTDIVLQPFTIMKVVSDFISESGNDKVSSRDLGRYLKILKVGDHTPPWSILDEIKRVYGGIYQFISLSDCFAVIDRSDEARDADPNDKSFWVGFRSDADMTLVKAAKEAKLSPYEREFFDEYSLDALDDTRTWYAHTIELAGLERGPMLSSRSYLSSRTSPPLDFNDDNDGGDNMDHFEIDIPEELTRAYGKYTVPILKDYCRKCGLKVSGTKAELLVRIQEYNDQEIAKLKAKSDALRQAQNRRGLGDVAFAGDIDHSDNRGVGPASARLVDLVYEYVRAAGGQANSRDVGRYLAANRASETRLKLGHSRNGRVSALQELKELHGSLAGFIFDHPDLFEKREIDVDGDGASYAFNVALTQSPATAQSTEATP